jgi:hypothetical protein
MPFFDFLRGGIVQLYVPLLVSDLVFVKPCTGFFAGPSGRITDKEHDITPPCLF